MWLPELGMYHYKARAYSPTLGRFMQPDPIGYGAGMNMYNYVGGDPVNLTDPSGLDPALEMGCPMGQTWSSSLRICVPGHDGSDITVTGRRNASYGNVQFGAMPTTTVIASFGVAVTPQKQCTAPAGESGASQRQLFDMAHRNADQAKWLPPLGFRDKVRNGGPWDYKQVDPQLQDFGNYNYGYTGNAAGFPLGVLLRQAGRAQEAAGTSRPGFGDSGVLGLVGGTAPYGDDPRDQEMIKRGYNDRAKGC